MYKQLIRHKLGGTEQEVDQEEEYTDRERSETRFTEEEVQYAIKIFKQDKAPGVDLIYVRMVRCINKTQKGLLLRLFNKCVSLGRFPKKWKEAEVVFFVTKRKRP